MTERDDDIAWIEARERGAMSDHPRAAVYARLGAAIASLPALSGGTAWRAAVLDQLDLPEGTDELARARAARVRRRGLAAALISALAVAALVFLLVHRGPRSRPVSASLAMTVGASTDARRATNAITIGVPVTLTAELPAAGELWIYGGERLVLRCPGAAGCSSAPMPGGVRIGATFRTEAALPHTVLLIEGTAIAPTGALSRDAALAQSQIRATRTFDVH